MVGDSGNLLLRCESLQSSVDRTRLQVRHQNRWQRKDPRPLAAEVVFHWMCAPVFCVGVYRILSPRLVVLHSNHTRTSSKKSEMMQQPCCVRDHRFERCLAWLTLWVNSATVFDAYLLYVLIFRLLFLFGPVCLQCLDFRKPDRTV